MLLEILSVIIKANLRSTIMTPSKKDKEMNRIKQRTPTNNCSSKRETRTNRAEKILVGRMEENPLELKLYIICR